MDKRYHELAKRQATEEEIENCLIYSQRALDYTKRELVAMLILMMKKQKEEMEFHSRSIRRRQMLMADFKKTMRIKRLE